MKAERQLLSKIIKFRSGVRTNLFLISRLDQLSAEPQVLSAHFSTDRSELNMSSNPSPLLNGLRDITMAEWWGDPLIVVSALERKLEGLPVDREANRDLNDQIWLVLRLLRALATRSYGRISMLAVIDILVAVDYFLVLQDEHPDSEVGGYDDDAELLAAVFRKHREELDTFRLWFNQSLSP